MYRNKSKIKSGNFEASQKQGFFRKKTLVVALLLLILGTSGYFGIKQKLNGKVSSAVSESHTDEIPGWWLEKYFGLSVCEQDDCRPKADPDNDKLTNLQEYFYHSDPKNAHTIGDKLNDGELVAQNIDPSRPGRVSFDDVTSMDNVMGEGLLFDADIRALINESVDPNNITLPVVKESEIKISNDNSETAIGVYLDANQKIFSNNFPSGAGNYIAQIADTPDEESLEVIREKCTSVVSELKKLAVPSEFVQIHKYNIIMFDLLPEVIDVPEPAKLQSEFNVEGNAWFDKAQALLTVYQKIDLESRRLQNKF